MKRVSKIALIFIFFILLDITDFILVLISYDDECRKYYVLRFINQFALVFLFLSAIKLGEHNPRNDPRLSFICFQR